MVRQRTNWVRPSVTKFAAAPVPLYFETAGVVTENKFCKATADRSELSLSPSTAPAKYFLAVDLSRSISTARRTVSSLSRRLDGGGVGNFLRADKEGLKTTLCGCKTGISRLGSSTEWDCKLLLVV